MKLFNKAILLVATMALGACAGLDVVTKNELPDTPLLTAMKGPGEATAGPRSYRVTGVDVVVPRSLTTTEVDSLKPRVDIVWHGELYGDRYEQVDRLVTAALKKGTAGLNGKRPVKIEAVLTRFHAQTHMVRRTFGGEHEVWMALAVRDARTGKLIEPARLVGFDIAAASGAQALAEDIAGRSQAVVITEALVAMIQNELTGTREAATAPVVAADEAEVAAEKDSAEG